MARQTQHTVSIDHNTYTLLHDISLKNDRSMRYLIHRAIVEYCNQHAQQTPIPCNITPIPQPTVVSHTTQNLIVKPIPAYIDEDVEGDEEYVDQDFGGEDEEETTGQKYQRLSNKQMTPTVEETLAGWQ